MTVAIGIGGVMHDYAAAVWADGALAALVTAEDVTGLPHGVDVGAMQRLFETAPSLDTAIGRWLLTVRESAVVEATVRAALATAGGARVTPVVLGYSCPEILLPPGIAARRVRVNHLDAHAAGVVEAEPDEVVVVFDTVGDRGPAGAHEVGAAFPVAGRPTRRWTAYEPASVGVLLDAAALVAGFPALDRTAADAVFTQAVPHPRSAAGDYVEDDGMPVHQGLSGLTWRDMVRPAARTAFAASISDGSTDGRRFAAVARDMAISFARRVVAAERRDAAQVWLAGEATRHRCLADALTGDGVQLARWHGDDGGAVGAARLALLSRD